MANEIKTFSRAQLEEVIAGFGLPRFRAKQLYEWLHSRRVFTYDEMNNIPKDLRERLKEEWPLEQPIVIDRQVSSDETRKYLLHFGDGLQVETVGMPSIQDKSKRGLAKHGSESGFASQSGKRLSVCFSTQVGCAMACSFCATGKEGFKRNLTCSEMIDQVAVVEKDFGCRVTNVVAMGQGEPFLNYEETLHALRCFNDSDGFNIGARHMTISTCGILRGIDKLSREPEQFTLAVSLHSAIQETRDMLMPAVSNQALDQLKTALIRYVDRTNRRVTLEYMLVRDVNDGEEDLRALLSFARNLLCHVNLLPVNAVDGAVFQPSSGKTIQRWVSCLSNAGIEATMRVSRGSDICGACGQLKNTRAKSSST